MLLSMISEKFSTFGSYWCPCFSGDYSFSLSTSFYCSFLYMKSLPRFIILSQLGRDRYDNSIPREGMTILSLGKV